ncbi:hypothetical protein MNB_SV-13-755 [hydrothermal vent metagenome]|uniref:SKICH domain-containing protein n=1 Tax=hydrothermal vent metagenome TaxID=652676 RepID=A0A1W1CUD5_9ZZZZ
MIKKFRLILVFLTLFTYTHANEEIDISSTTLKNGAIILSIHLMNVGPKDWIAVYPKNSDTSWANVIDWRWVKRLPNQEGLNRNLYKGASRIKKPGEYRVLYFKNNSYTIYKSFDFTIKKIDSFVEKLWFDPIIPGNPIAQITVNGFTHGVTAPASDEWIGIYKKDDDNSWGNVIQWVWTKDLKFKRRSARYTNYLDMYLDTNKYEVGAEYEARYFLNNSFDTHKKIKFKFTIPNKLKGFYSSVANSIYVTLNEPNFSPNPKDWFGIYKVGDSNAWVNVVRWVWAKNLKARSNYRHYFDYQFKNIDLEEGKYEIRYFLNNSFTVNHKSDPFIIK